MSQKITKELKVFVIDKERVPVGPPNPAIVKEVSGDNFNELKQAALKMLSGYGRVRSLNFSPNGLVGYVEEL